MKPNPCRILAALLCLVGLPTALPAQQSTLTVLKEVAPIGDPTVFSFSLEGDAGTVPFTLTQQQSEEFTLDSGTYVVREDVPENWELSQIRCGVLFELGPVASGAIRLDLQPGESVLCRFLNTNPDVPPPPPPGLIAVPTVSPTLLSVLMMVLAAAGALLLRNVD